MTKAWKNDARAEVKGQLTLGIDLGLSKNSLRHYRFPKFVFVCSRVLLTIHESGHQVKVTERSNDDAARGKGKTHTRSSIRRIMLYTLQVGPVILRMPGTRSKFKES